MTKPKYEDSVNYAVPESLTALHGPVTGVIELPRHLYWGPEEAVDLSKRHDVRRMYQAVLRVGTAADQVQWLDRDLLLSVWAELVLPLRCARVWENTFSELQK